MPHGGQQIQSDAISSLDLSKRLQKWGFAYMK